MNNLQNPLLEKTNAHRLKAFPFDRIKTEHYLPAFEVALAEAKVNVDKIRKDTSAPTFENTIMALEFAGEQMEYIANIYFSLFSAEADAEFTALAQQISPKLAEFNSSISTDADIFARVSAVYNEEVKGKPKPVLPDDLSDIDALTTAERYRIIEQTYKSFVRNGAMLSDDDKKKLTAINMELSTLSPKFSENVLNATNAFELHITDITELDGLPESALNSAAYLAKKKGKDRGWLFNLQPANMTPVMTYAKNRALREKLQRAYSSRAFQDAYDNQTNIKRITTLRHERANLLGYKTHADYVLAERMALSYETAVNFLDKIYDKAYHVAKKEVEETIFYAKETDGLSDLMAWDFGYYANKLKEKKYAFDPEVLRPWFKVENTVQGLFDVARKIYGISLKQVYDVPVYHPEVTTWEVYDADDTYQGLLYLDLFPRDTKRGGAWMTTFQTQGLYPDGLRRPFVGIVASLTPSTDTAPSLLRLSEVETLFHEFGHAIHALLSDCHYRAVASPNVLWDFVELPSQIMENWLLEKEALNLFARHYQTGELLPEDLLDKVVTSRNFHSGIANINQLRYAMLDFGWHASDPTSIEDVDAFEKQISEKYRLLPQVDGANISCAFSHIFAGGYSAGYYSYKWAEALEADAWSLFKEKGIFNTETANSFRYKILARGNSYHPMDLFIAFRGRTPDPDALLKRDGLL